MGNTLYKRTHLTAAVIFIALMVSAGSAIALIGQPDRTESPAAGDPPSLGRFVVSPNHMHFVAPAKTEH